MTDKPFTKTLRGATWPTIACHADRMCWVAEILRDDGIKVDVTGNDELDLALALLAFVYRDRFVLGKAQRVAAFKAAIEIEKELNRR